MRASAVPPHWHDNSSHSGDAGLVCRTPRLHELSAAIDAVLADTRFAPLLAAERVGACGTSADGHCHPVGGQQRHEL
jgi:hypothetical protein